ncbi:hypothetical protein GGQ22_07755 [Nocardioides sp. zg-579]|uniref:Peptidase C39 domain-containing protein n=1 Tax=Nocardioides marmotae TaxID=2663857 RepID=A0A6I3JA66_9ACTN|nr:hypothetical protein [Nocardioides marmotae]MCR6031339.1 hypothetical protein [Gordonia jinghuaiqii]MTB94978.1 hypothetical protein [Nocardioides marmotae]QKE02515.1 hypothetical protein HPC71_16655 [Nocardioides marmotae]
MSLPWGATLRQPDPLSCGASVLVVARMLAEEEYAARAARAFPAEVLALHRRVTGPRSRDGRAQLPWPRAIGTPPWAVARELALVTGVPHRVRPARWSTLHDAPGPVALYVGNRWLPRHVVLVLAVDEERLRLYDPAVGGPVAVTRRAFEARRLRVAGWDRPWFAVVPARG